MCCVVKLNDTSKSQKSLKQVFVDLLHICIYILYFVFWPRRKPTKYKIVFLPRPIKQCEQSLKRWRQSLKEIRKCFVNGVATKDDFEKALRAHKEAKDEMKSDQREAAAEPVV